MNRFHRYQPIFLKRRTLFNKSGSEKKTFHLVFDISHLDVSFCPGDCAAILPMNDPLLVEKTLFSMKAKKEEKIFSPFSLSLVSLEDFLLYQANISKVPSALFRMLLDLEKIDRYDSLFLPENKTLLADHLHSYELWDFLETFSKTSLSAQELCSKLFPLSPRFYSIASSQSMFPKELHLLVGELSYTNQYPRHGVASHFLCDLAEEGKTPIPFYVHSSHHFTLPKNPKTPIIMIGPGTGIAPFQSFIQERLVTNAPGKNWLFFGECHRSLDFYYEEFLLDLVKKNFLILDLAFSRDGPQKIYVQHLLFEKRKEIWHWIESENAYLYLCGNAQKMAKDVDLTLQKIVQLEGNKTEEEAQNYLKTLRHQKRYLKDIY